jgi:hypothetical protein
MCDPISTDWRASRGVTVGGGRERSNGNGKLEGRDASIWTTWGSSRSPSPSPSPLSLSWPSRSVAPLGLRRWRKR